MAYSVFAQRRRRFCSAPSPSPLALSPINPAFDTISVRAVRALYEWQAEIDKKRRPVVAEPCRPKEPGQVSVNGTDAWEKMKLVSWKDRGLLREDGSLRCQPVKPPPSVKRLRLLFPGLALDDAREIRERMNRCG